MKKRTRLVAIILILALVVTAVPTGIALLGGTGGITSEQRQAALSEASDLSAASWMSAVDDNTKISSMTIPGTHDSATAHITPGYFLQCQKLGFSDQLYAGFRYLDIRLAVDSAKKDDPDKLKFIHAFGNCRKSFSPMSGNLHLDDCLTDVYNFLDENPSETVIFCVKNEGGDDPAVFENLFFEYLDKNPEKWYTQNKIPTLGEVRGKIVLCTRFEDVNGMGDEKMGLTTHWSQQENKEVINDPQEVGDINGEELLYVQDRFKYNIRDKWQAFVMSMENCMAGDVVLSLNFLSTSGSGSAGHPKSYAKTLNSQLLSLGFSKDRIYGVVIVDFGEEALARHIFAANID